MQKRCDTQILPSLIDMMLLDVGEIQTRNL